MPTGQPVQHVTETIKFAALDAGQWRTDIGFRANSPLSEAIAQNMEITPGMVRRRSVEYFGVMTALCQPLRQCVLPAATNKGRRQAIQQRASLSLREKQHAPQQSHRHPNRERNDLRA
ncbi:hypothetical protein XJ20_22550 [Serratia liquefaciens]|nr:hypothetical protein XJ20_22550 [Serratia liquefaciens]